MTNGRTDADFVRPAPEEPIENIGKALDAELVGAAPAQDQHEWVKALDAELEEAAPIHDQPDWASYEPVALDFVELYAENFNHFARLAAILDPDEPDELIDNAFLEVARRSHPPMSRTVALIAVRDSLVSQYHKRSVGPRQPALITLPESDDPVIRDLENLPVFQRDCLVLYHYAAMTSAEIATALHTNDDKVEGHLEFAEAKFEAMEGVDARDIGDRIRRAIAGASRASPTSRDLQGSSTAAVRASPR
jgi:DNA-directed RNA polymerase specialized sigma24 family protein